jgi:RNase P/RNase MRP subunit POP5
MKANKKLKLKASARDNRRYLLINEMDGEKIERAILNYIGVLGFAKAAYMFVKKEKNGIVVAVKREELERVKASLAFAGIAVERVSGTIKGLGR